MDPTGGPLGWLCLGAVARSLGPRHPPDPTQAWVASAPKYELKLYRSGHQHWIISRPTALKVPAEYINTPSSFNSTSWCTIFSSTLVAFFPSFLETFSLSKPFLLFLLLLLILSILSPSLGVTLQNTNLANHHRQDLRSIHRAIITRLVLYSAPHGHIARTCVSIHLRMEPSLPVQDPLLTYCL